MLPLVVAPSSPPWSSPTSTSSSPSSWSDSEPPSIELTFDCLCDSSLGAWESPYTPLTEAFVPERFLFSEARTLFTGDAFFRFAPRVAFRVVPLGL